MTDSFLPGLALMAALFSASCLLIGDHGRVRKRLRGLQPGPGSGRLEAVSNKAVRNRASGQDTRPAASPDGGLHGLRDTAMMLDLVAAMLDAGSGLGRSLELVAASASTEYSTSLRPVVSALAIGADWDTAWRSSEVRLPHILELRDALAFAAMTGAPSSAILYAQAARLRRERFRAAEKRAASLGVKLVIPLGLCSLPAFICLGVVPVLLALVPSGS
jgi:hypothetical protein